LGSTEPSMASDANAEEMGSSGSESGRDLDAARNEAALAEQRYAAEPTPENEAAMQAAFDKVNALMEGGEQIAGVTANPRVRGT
jgi:hypothetical protein